MRQTGMHWEMLKKILEHPSPLGYQQTQLPQKPESGPYLDRIREILEADKPVHRKERHTAKRICFVCSSSYTSWDSNQWLPRCLGRIVQLRLWLDHGFA